MKYTKSYFEDAVSKYGEVFFVLHSGEKYEVHGSDSYEFNEVDGHTVVHVKGTRDGTLYFADFPLDTIEHHAAHREV